MEFLLWLWKKAPPRRSLFSRRLYRYFRVLSMPANMRIWSTISQKTMTTWLVNKPRTKAFNISLLLINERINKIIMYENECKKFSSMSFLINENMSFSFLPVIHFIVFQVFYSCKQFALFTIQNNLCFEFKVKNKLAKSITSFRSSKKKF